MGIVIAFVVGSCFIVLFFVCWKGTTTGQQYEAEQMKACVAAGKSWDWNDEDNVRVCR